MATSKLWAVHNSVGDALSYVEDEEKTQASLSELIPNITDGVKCENGRLLLGINCDPKTAAQEMNAVKEKFGKTGGVTAYHGYISFGPKDKLSPVDVLEIARQVAQKIWGDRFQVLLGVHTNTETLHCHFVVNSVSFVDGLKAANYEHYPKHLRHVVDDVCKENNISVTKMYSRERIPKGDLLHAISIAVAEGGGDANKTAEELAKYGIQVLGNNRVRSPDGVVYIPKHYDPSLVIKKPDVLPKKKPVAVISMPKLDLSNVGKPVSQPEPVMPPVPKPPKPVIKETEPELAPELTKVPEVEVQSVADDKNTPNLGLNP